MKYQIFLILGLITLYASASTIQDTYLFDKDWRKVNDNDIKIHWKYDSGSKKCNFALDYPSVPASLNINQFVFLKTKYDANSFISHFEPVQSSSGGRSHWKQDILLSVLDDKKTGANTYDCPRVLSSDGLFETQTCSGWLAFAHKSEKSSTRAERFKTGEDHALLRFTFKLEIRYDLTVADTVNLIVKTKITDLPCLDCKKEECTDPCRLNVNFKITHKLCLKNEYACTQVHAPSYFYGDIAYIRFDLDVKTRTMELHSIFATSALDSTGAQLPNNVLTTSKNTDKGVFYLGIPIAGPAQTGGRDFSLKFIFKLETFAKRFLEDANDRVLQTGPTDVTYKDIDGFKAIDENDSELNATIEEPELGKVYTFCIAMIGLISLTCLCLTVSNLVPLLKKRNYEQAPTQVVKNNA